MNIPNTKAHLAYCTNIHPAESWEETFTALKTHVLAVRDSVSTKDKPYAIGLRLSAIAANQLLKEHYLEDFKIWLHKENCYVFTINGFPYGQFHETRVKENVYKPDWTKQERIDYTKNLFRILSSIMPNGAEGSVSTLPGSFKEFDADENIIIENLHEIALFIEDLAKKKNQDLHLGLEPEPLGMFENLSETISFFDNAFSLTEECSIFKNRIGVNYDACHFAIEFEDAQNAIQHLTDLEIRISKIHLSNALSLDPKNPETIERLKKFDEPTYLHQVVCKDDQGTLAYFKDLPLFLELAESTDFKNVQEARVHFHIPLYADPEEPLQSTRSHAEALLDLLKNGSLACNHFEIETYTWGVLPEMKQNITQMIAQEYQWTLSALS